MEKFRIKIALCIFLSCPLLLCCLPPTLENSSLVTVYFFDVGQGDAIFVDTGGLDMLIDGGPRSEGSRLVGYLNELHVLKLDIIVATHPHEDHIGGLINVLSSSITIDTVLHNGQIVTTKVYSDFIKIAQDKLKLVERGQIYVLDTNVNFTVLNPTQPLEFSDVNSNSIVLRLQAGNVAFLFTGDATLETENSIMALSSYIQSQVLKVAHHGSRYSTSDRFLDAVKPTYAVISAGKSNPYGHPHQETLQRLMNHGIIIYETYTHGTIVMRTDGQIIKVDIGEAWRSPSFDFTISLQERLLYLALAFMLIILFLACTYKRSKRKSAKKKF